MIGSWIGNVFRYDDKVLTSDINIKLCNLSLLGMVDFIKLITL